MSTPSERPTPKHGMWTVLAGFCEETIPPCFDWVRDHLGMAEEPRIRAHALALHTVANELVTCLDEIERWVHAKGADAPTEADVVATHETITRLCEDARKLLRDVGVTIP